jgi:adenylate kinase
MALPLSTARAAKTMPKGKGYGSKKAGKKENPFAKKEAGKKANPFAKKPAAGAKKPAAGKKAAGKKPMPPAMAKRMEMMKKKAKGKK